MRVSWIGRVGGSPFPASRGYLPTMCGRTTLTITPGDLEKTFGFPVPAGYRSSYNIAPTQSLLALAESRGERALRQYRWGLIPYWAADASIGNRMINARAETLATKSAFRELFARRRCLVVVDGYYEWMKDPTRKRPHRVRHRSGGAFTLGGVWDRWRQGGQVMESCAIITTASNTHLARLHDRMPLVIAGDDRESWLSRETAPEKLPSLLDPYATDDLEMYEVSTLVNRPDNDSEECIEPVGDVNRSDVQEDMAEPVQPIPDTRSGASRGVGADADGENYSLFNDLDQDSDGSH